MRRFASYVLPVALYAGLIFVLSSGSGPPLRLFVGADKVIHFVEYGVLGWLCARALKAYGSPALVAARWAVLLTAAYGATDELHQRFTANRSPELLDWAADILGAAVAAALWYARQKVSAPEAKEV